MKKTINMPTQRPSRPARSRAGDATVEYMLVVTAVVLASAAVLSGLGTNLTGRFSEIQGVMNGTATGTSEKDGGGKPTGSSGIG